MPEVRHRWMEPGAGSRQRFILCTEQRREEKWPLACRLSEASETAVHGVRKWSGKTGLEIIITGPSADLGLHGPGLPGTGPPYGAQHSPRPEEPGHAALGCWHCHMLTFCGRTGQRARALHLYDVFRRRCRCYLSKYSALPDTTHTLCRPRGELMK